MKTDDIRKTSRKWNKSSRSIKLKAIQHLNILYFENYHYKSYKNDDKDSRSLRVAVKSSNSGLEF